MHICQCVHAFICSRVAAVCHLAKPANGDKRGAGPPAAGAKTIAASPARSGFQGSVTLGASPIVTSKDRPGLRTIEIRPACSRACKARWVVVRGIPSSASPFPTDSLKVRDFRQPASFHSSRARARDFPGKAAACRIQSHGIGPRRNFPPCWCLGGRFEGVAGAVHPGGSRKVSRSENGSRVRIDH